MSVQILHDRKDDVAVLYDTVTETAFGPLIWNQGGYSGHDIACQFLNWLDMDARRYDSTTLREKFDEWSPTVSVGQSNG